MLRERNNTLNGLWKHIYILGRKVQDELPLMLDANGKFNADGLNERKFF